MNAVWKNTTQQPPLPFFELFHVYSIEVRYLRSVMRVNVPKYLNKPLPRGFMQSSNTDSQELAIDSKSSGYQVGKYSQSNLFASSW